MAKKKEQTGNPITDAAMVGMPDPASMSAGVQSAGAILEEHVREVGKRAPKPDEAARVGDMVQYRLTAEEAGRIESLQADGRCNPHKEGELVAAVVTRVWSQSCVNLRVFFDGEPTIWATSRVRGDGVCNWQPVR